MYVVLENTVVHYKNVRKAMAMARCYMKQKTDAQNHELQTTCRLNIFIEMTTEPRGMIESYIVLGNFLV